MTSTKNPDWDTIEKFYSPFALRLPLHKVEGESERDWQKRKKKNEENLRTAINLFRAQATMTGFDVARKHIAVKGRCDVDYDRAREISNSLYAVEPLTDDDGESIEPWLQDHRPEAVASPRNAEQVSMCVRFCRAMNLKVRVRSGGHHHEGMSSGSHGVFVIRLTELNTITYPNVRRDAAWLPVGKKLENVYYELELHQRTIAGGGCQSVNVGGLTLGGGWGSSARAYGLACDSLIEAEVVLVDGTIVRANAHNNYADLFWALRGGGGGNFGIVTRFLYRLVNLEGKTVVTFVHRFNYGTTDSSGERDSSIAATLIDNWMAFHEQDKETGLSATIVLRKSRDEAWDKEPVMPVTIGGKYYMETDKSRDPIDVAKAVIEKHFFTDLPATIDWSEKSGSWIRAVTIPKPGESLSEEMVQAEGEISAEGEIPGEGGEFTIDALLSWLKKEFGNALGAKSQTDQDRELFDALQPGPSLLSAPRARGDAAVAGGSSQFRQPKRVPVTCDAPHPHKVSSAFPNSPAESKSQKELNVEVRERLLSWLNVSPEEVYRLARCYIVLHAFGGMVRLVQPEEASTKQRPGAFPFRDKDYLLQFQAWWQEPTDSNSPCYIDWVKASRANLADAGLIEGAFLNFADKDLPPEGHELGLLGYYYRDPDTLTCLQNIKARYDRDDVLSFPMGVVPRGGPSSPKDYQF